MSVHLKSWKPTKETAMRSIDLLIRHGLRPANTYHNWRWEAPYLITKSISKKDGKTKLATPEFLDKNSRHNHMQFDIDSLESLVKDTKTQLEELVTTSQTKEQYGTSTEIKSPDYFNITASISNTAVRNSSTVYRTTKYHYLGGTYPAHSENRKADIPLQRGKVTRTMQETTVNSQCSQ